jgi:protein-L-isoaspartate(D-aspartate) O-methyltransferase
MPFDVEKARFNMVEQQIRTWDVLDQTILDLLFTVRREEFVPAAARQLAFADLEIPIGEGQRMWAPRVEARVLQELAIAPREEVLEIGTGSGYFAALLARRAARVTTLEIFRSLHEQARSTLAAHGFGNVDTVLGDGARGWGEAHYDVIVLTGSTPVLPERFLGQLRPGGRLFAIVGEAPVMHARLITSGASGTYVARNLFETVVEPLVNAEQASGFSF